MISVKKLMEGIDNVTMGELKQNHKYTWGMGAEFLECTYLGHGSKPGTFKFKVGNSEHQLSIKDIKDYIYPLEYMDENIVKEAEEYGDLTNFDKRRVDVNELKKQLKALKEKLSPAGWQLIVKFVKGATGINRSWIIGKLYEIVNPKRPYLTRTELRSYANTDLHKLIDTGDLEDVKGKLYYTGA